MCACLLSTALAIREAKRRCVPVFDFNVSVCLKTSPSFNAKTVLGPAEATLPTLARLAGVPIFMGGQDCSSTSVSSTSPSTSPTIEQQLQEKKQREEGGGNSEDDESPLGRRARDESFNDNGDASDAKVARCFPGGGATHGGDAAGGPVLAAAAVAKAVDDRAGVWGGGAKYLLEPVLEPPLRKDQVRVDLSEAFSRKPHPDPEVCGYS